MYRRVSKQWPIGPAAYFCCCSVAKSCLTRCDPTDCSTPGSPVPHGLPEFAQIHIHWVSDEALLDHSLVHPCMYCLWLLSCCYGKSSRCCNRSYMAHKPKLFTIPLFTDRSPSPYLFLALNYYKYWIYEYSSSWFLVGMCRVALLYHRACKALALANTAKQCSKMALPIYPVTSNTKVPVLQF